ncbi:Protein priA [Hypsizygus marmoreus]|uniref:Protein priA n=1 Tax=Hypsizygus marmoreus TaxID=39966 RepID=A0A369KAR9_HYPMA|nr:Protein priA [Hypsizygus marmoreus]
MTLITRIAAAVTLLAVVFPLASAHATENKGCTKKEFWSTLNACCLPIGGPPSPPPPPPQGSNCPPSTHYWGRKQGCCVPRNPPPENGPPPQCPKGWTWTSTVRRCEPIPTPPSNPPPTPSKYHGGNNHGNHGQHDNDNGGGDHDHGIGYNGHRQKRSAHWKSRSAPLCPTGLDACPISSMKSGDYECLDTTTELESCGGCSSIGAGQDCTTITGAWNVGCEQGSCKVYTCAGGYIRARDGKSCIPI